MTPWVRFLGDHPDWIFDLRDAGGWESACRNSRSLLGVFMTVCRSQGLGDGNADDTIRHADWLPAILM
jgi:hypothetical protein